MLRWASKYFGSIPAMWTDGALYVSISVLTFWSQTFGSDEAAKWFSPLVLWWIKFVVGTFAQVSLGIKLFRSSAYSDHLKEQKEKQNEKPPISSTPTSNV